MDKQKLVNMIVKDLEEIRVLSVEVVDNEEDLGLIIDLALYRARLLCQEFELLRELTGNSSSVDEETDEDDIDNQEDDDSDIHFSDPELEITNFDNQNFHSMEEITNDKDLEVKEEGETKEDEDSDWEIKKEQVPEIKEEIPNQTQEQYIAEKLNEKDLTKVESKNHKIDLNNEAETENSKTEKSVNHTELKNEFQPGMREIHIDELDDDDIKPIGFSPLAGSIVRPPMVEIPKPEFVQSERHEKQVVGDKFQKERSINDSIGENQSGESKQITGRIANLRAAIGLNDRFLFIREIFDNNTEKYNNVIEHLDKMEQIQEAVEYLKANLTMQKNEASMKFVELLKRRFSK